VSRISLVSDQYCVSSVSNPKVGKRHCERYFSSFSILTSHEYLWD